METLLRDVRFGVKLLLKEKTFSVTVLLTLAVCIGANVAIFSVIDAVLLRPLPYAHPDRLVTIYNSYPGAGAPRGATSSTDYFMQRGHIDALEEEAQIQGWGPTIGEAGSTERVQGLRVTPSFFSLLGMQPIMGRTFTEDEMTVGNHREVVLSYGYWQEHFGGAPDVVGKGLRVDGETYTVVGVLPERFTLVQQPGIKVFAPTPYTDDQRTVDSWHNNGYALMGRLRPGATAEQATAQIAALNESLMDRWPATNAREILKSAGFHTVVVKVQDDLVRDVKPILYLLWAGVAFVFLLGCVNIANLMLARAQVRMGEMATRLALGAERLRVARQVLTESVVIGVLGGILGVGVGALGLRLLSTLGVDNLPRWAEVGIDGPVLLFTLALAVGAGVLFGAIPVVHVMRGDLNAVFRMEGRTGTASRKAVLVRSSLVTTQVAVAFVMLIGAGLMLMSFRAALSVDPGFRPDGVFTALVSLPEARYPNEDQRRQFADDLLGSVRSIPGVEAASITTNLPFSGNNSSSVIFPEGYVPKPGESVLSPAQTRAGPGYFEAMGIPLVQGRTFTEADGPDQPNVVIIDEWLAHRYWPDTSPLGHRMVYGVAPGDSVPPENRFTIIGVVKDIKQNDLTAPASEHVGAYYFTYRQGPPAFLSLVVRTATGATTITPAIRETLRRIDPELPLFQVRTMEQRISDSLISRRVPLLLLLAFAGIALFLAVVGIYGALAYSVTQRTREIGIRVAMGSTPKGIFRIVVGQGIRVAGVGLVLGAVASLLLTRLMASMLFQISPTDLRVMGAVALILGLIALAACLVPAHRATSVDPVTALTYQ